jgi:hypothetical protein
MTERLQCKDAESRSELQPLCIRPNNLSMTAVKDLDSCVPGINEVHTHDRVLWCSSTQESLDPYPQLHVHQPQPTLLLTSTCGSSSTALEAPLTPW